MNIQHTCYENLKVIYMHLQVNKNVAWIVLDNKLSLLII